MISNDLEAVRNINSFDFFLDSSLSLSFSLSLSYIYIRCDIKGCGYVYYRTSYRYYHCRASLVCPWWGHQQHHNNLLEWMLWPLVSMWSMNVALYLSVSRIVYKWSISRIVYKWSISRIVYKWSISRIVYKGSISRIVYKWSTSRIVY